MTPFFTPNNQQGEAPLMFLEVLLDADGTLYTFNNDLPIFVQGGGLQQIGVAQLNRKRKKLYGDLILKNQQYCVGLFAHILHDVYGHIYAILLNDQALRDPSIHCLDQQDVAE